MEAYPRVEIRWVDSTIGGHGWQSAEEVADHINELGGPECRTTGYLIHESESWLTIAMTVGDLGNVTGYLGILSIPTRALLSVEREPTETEE